MGAASFCSANNRRKGISCIDDRIQSGYSRRACNQNMSAKVCSMVLTSKVISYSLS